MNVVFLPCISYNVGLQTSAAFWNIVRPNPSLGEVTLYLYAITQDINGNAWAQIDLDYTVAVPQGSTGALILSNLQAAVTAGTLTPSDVAWTQAAITAAQARTVNISSLIAPGLMAQAQTQSEMVANGLLSLNQPN